MTDYSDLKSLNQLVADKASENERLEFKAILPGRDDKAKHELAKDFSAMANAHGGTIIYGVAEIEGNAQELLPITDEPADNAIRRLTQCLESGVEPRIHGISFQEVSTPAGYILVVTIAPSFNGPHRVIFNGKSHFYIRGARSISEFSYQQLRDAFTLHQRAENRIEGWRAERLAKIKSGRGARSLIGGCTYVIHMMPLVAFTGFPLIDPTPFYRKSYELLYGRVTSCSDFLNLDGVVAVSHAGSTGDHKYVQLFRTGTLEAVAFSGTLIADTKIIPSEYVAKEIRAALRVHSTILTRIGIQGPVAIGFSLLSIGDHKLYINDFEGESSTDRDDLELPLVWAGSPDEIVKSVDQYLQPILNMLWQSFDLERCDSYDENNNWKLGG